MLFVDVLAPMWHPRPPPAPLTQPAGASSSCIQLSAPSTPQTLSQILGPAPGSGTWSKQNLTIVVTIFLV